MTQTQSPWWQSAIIYQVYPRSFCDANQDGVGDLKGILSKLDYLAFLGVDAVWISPFFKSPMKDFGYDVSDYCDVDPLFGTLQDFDTLLQAAQAKNIRILIDLVPCHTSDQHPWFHESRQSRDNAKSDWYIWADPKNDGSPPNNWRSFFGGPAWEWDSRRGQYYLHHFLKEQPNLNYRHTEVANALCDVIRFWFDRGVDGLRLDAIVTLFCNQALKDNPARPLSHFLRTSIKAKANPFHLQEHRYSINQHDDVIRILGKIRALASQYGDKFLIGEIGGQDSPLPDTAISALYTADGGLHSSYNFELLGGPFSSSALRSILEKTFNSIKAGNITFTLSNHDVVRVATRWANSAALAEDSVALAKLALCLLLTLPGSVCLYQGEELGLTQAEVPFSAMRDPEGINGYPAHLGRDGCRTPMPWCAKEPHAGFSATTPWLPVSPQHLPLAVDVQTQSADSVLQLTKRLIAWRKQEPALTVGNISFLDFPEPFLGFLRGNKEQKVLCVFNLSSGGASLTLPAGNWKTKLAVGVKGHAEQPVFGAYGSYIAIRAY